MGGGGGKEGQDREGVQRDSDEEEALSAQWSGGLGLRKAIQLITQGLLADLWESIFWENARKKTRL